MIRVPLTLVDRIPMPEIHAAERRARALPRSALVGCLCLAAAGAASAQEPTRTERNVAPGGTERSVEITVDNSESTSTMEGVRVELLQAPRYVTDVRISPSVADIPGGAVQRFAVSFTVRGDAPPGAVEELRFGLSAESGWFDHQELTLEVRIAEEAFVLTEIRGPTPRAAQPSSDTSVTVEHDSNSPGYIRRRRARERLGENRRVESWSFDSFPLQIVPGESFSVGFRYRVREDHAPSYISCTDPARRPQDLDRVHFVYTYSWSRSAPSAIAHRSDKFEARAPGVSDRYCDEVTQIGVGRASYLAPPPPLYGGMTKEAEVTASLEFEPLRREGSVVIYEVKATSSTGSVEPQGREFTMRHHTDGGSVFQYLYIQFDQLQLAYVRGGRSLEPGSFDAPPEFNQPHVDPYLPVPTETESTTTVPPLVGFPLADARRLLEGRSLTARVTIGPPAPTPAGEGLVTAQSPGADTTVAVGSEVEITLLGPAQAPVRPDPNPGTNPPEPATATVPPLVGYPLQDARRLLESRALRARVTVGPPAPTRASEGRVTAQSPGAGSTVPVGSEVEITLFGPSPAPDNPPPPVIVNPPPPPPLPPPPAPIRYRLDRVASANAFPVAGSGRYPEVIESDARGGRIVVPIVMSPTCREEVVFTWSFDRDISLLEPGDEFTVTMGARVSGDCAPNRNPFVVAGSGGTLLTGGIRNTLTSAQRNGLRGMQRAGGDGRVYAKATTAAGRNAVGSGTTRFVASSSVQSLTGLWFGLTFSATSPRPRESFEWQVAYLFVR